MAVEIIVVVVQSLNDVSIFAPKGVVETYIYLPWNAPQINPLTVVLSSEESPTRLLETFSHHLRYLDLYPARNNISDRLAYAPSLKECSALSAVCPHLEHLIVPHLLDITPYPLLVKSPTLIHLDLHQPQTLYHHTNETATGLR